MTTSDPYQKTFATVEELLSNPRGRVRQNPSKGFETILAAVKASDGWVLRVGNSRFAYGVLSGPMTGTYLIGQKNYGYRPDIGSYVRYERTGLRYKVAKILKPLFVAVGATGLANNSDFHYRPLKSTDQVRAEILGRMESENDLDDHEHITRASAWQKTLDDFTADPEGFTEKLNLDYIIMSPAFDMAEMLYVLSQAGGVPVNTVIDQVKEKPKRLLSLVSLRIPTRLTDRTRYAAEFLRTWSAGKAADRIVPNVEGGMPAQTGQSYMGWEPQEIRNLLNKVPSWRQMAAGQQSRAERNQERQDELRRVWAGLGRAPPAPKPRLSDQQIALERTGTWIDSMIRIQEEFQSEGISPKVFREQLLRKYEGPQLVRLLDALRGVRQGAALLVQTPEGRLLVRAREERDWPRLLRGHDLAVAAAGEMRNTSSHEALAAAETFKRGAEQFIMIPGVRPLITKSEYKCEGDEMKHCVHDMGYYLNRDGYEFAIAAPDGTRATLELDSKMGTTRQLFGPEDSTPSAATRKMANAFLAINKNNIALMRQGKFPVYAKDER